MALKLVSSGVQPLGQFDGYDTDLLNVKGGEVLQFGQMSDSGTDGAVKDAFDGYVNTNSVASRPVVRFAYTDGYLPLMLSDDGVAGYGTLFGTLVGAVGGQDTGTVSLGPSTVSGSGKITAWDKPGLYAVSLDACDTTEATGLQPTNTTIYTGAPLYAHKGDGILTPNVSYLGGGSILGTNKVVGRFVSFETNGSLVNTPNYLVSALNSPSGSAAAAGQFAFAVFHFNPVGE